MRLLQIIRENTLNAIRGDLNVSVISSQAYQPEQLQDLVAALRRHSLISGIDANGNFIRPSTPVKAWTGPVPQEWTPAVGNAIKAWKRSINFQVSQRADRPLDASSATINSRDLEYLIDARLTDQGYLALTGNASDRTPDMQPNRQAAWSTMEDTKQLAAGVDAVTDMNSFINSIGWSGWKVIAEEIVRLKDQTGSNSEVNRIIQRANQSRQQFPEQWITIWRTEVLLNQDYEAVIQPSLSSPETISVDLVPPREVYAGGTDPYKGLYNYFARIAQGLWNKEKYIAQREEEDRELLASTAAEEETLNATNIAVIVAAFAEALNNKWWQPRFISDADGESISDLMLQINSAADWDNIVNEFERAGHGFLGYRLADEMEPDDYSTIVVVRLVRLRRIMPIRLFAAINFSAAEEIEVTVEYADISGDYILAKEKLPNNELDIKAKTGRTNPITSVDVLFQDTLLRAAIENTGGTIPSADIELTRQSIDEAKNLFIITLENTYPEMTSWYAYNGTIWQEKQAPDLGRARLLGIIAEAAKVIQDGGNYDTVPGFIEDEILSDREWLVGTQEDPGGVGNITFDPAWQDVSQGFFPAASISDEIELDGDESALLSALLDGQEDVQRQAARDILESPDPDVLYERLYRVASRSRKYLEKILGDPNTIEDYINGSNDGTLITMFLSEIPMPIVAPRTMAELFNEAIKNIGTKDELLRNLTSILTAEGDRKHYQIVSEFYSNLTNTGSSLAADIDWENWDFLGDENIRMLRQMIGDEIFDLESNTENLPQRIRKELADLQTDPTRENIIEFARVANSAASSGNNGEIYSRENCVAIVRFLEEILDSNRVQPSTPNYVAVTEIHNHITDKIDAYDDNVRNNTSFPPGNPEMMDAINAGVEINFDIDRLEEIFENEITSLDTETTDTSGIPEQLPTDEEIAAQRFP